jgi:hypothetical protein
MPADPRQPGAKQDENEQDAAVDGTFPASDPPATMGNEAGSRAVPPDEMMDQPRAVPYDAVTLRRRFPNTEAAKLALEGLVRDGPMERNAAQLKRIGNEIELVIAADPDDCHRLRGLLARA